MVMDASSLHEYVAHDARWWGVGGGGWVVGVAEILSGMHLVSMDVRLSRNDSPDLFTLLYEL